MNADPQPARGASRSAGPDVALYAGTLLLASFLLFAIEPLTGKLTLPLLGGAAAVWTTTLVFFQAVLLAGYLAAHAAARALGAASQVLLLLGLLSLGALFLPVALPEALRAPESSQPIAWLLGLLAGTVGGPFFALSLIAPLLQRWFARTGHPYAGDPYFLYAASNAGGVIALFAYPTLIEPWLGVRMQSRVWTILYLLLAAGVVACGLRARQPAPALAGPGPRAAGARRGERLHWLLLALVPSSLLLGTTQHLTTDVASVPFLWVAPLGLYLGSFVVAFARRPPLRHERAIDLQLLLLAGLALFFGERDVRLAVPLHLLALFASALVCHGELARRRPPVGRLTEFYLWLSLGGFLGGVFNAVCAPLLFSWVLEYPLMIVAVCLLRPGSWDRWPRDLLAGAGFAAGFVLLAQLARQPFAEAWPLAPLGFALALGALYLFRARPLSLAIGVAGMLGATALLPQEGRVLTQQRSFFGVYRVDEDAAGLERRLAHGTTVHGAQYLDPGRLREPAAYYGRTGPLGQALAVLDPDAHGRIGVIGLGAGALACYREPEQSLVFFEIDPLVLEIARDPGLFRFLSECPGSQVQIGDGRLALQRLPPASFDLLIVDAFGSDAIPVHLLTREALGLYFARLGPGGVALLHVSNSHLDLGPVVASLARDAGLVALEQRYTPPPAASLELASHWVVLARTHERLALLDPRWQPLVGDGRRPWTDDFSNVVGALL